MIVTTKNYFYFLLYPRWLDSFFYSIKQWIYRIVFQIGIFFLYFIHVLSTCAGKLTACMVKKKGTKNLWKENPLTWFSFRKCFSLAYMYLVYISKINQVSGVLPSKVWLCIEGVVLILYSSFSMFFCMIIYQCFDFMFLVSY